MSLCETIAPGLLGITGPMLGASLVAAFGGLNTEGIRPLFFISLIGTIASFLLILRYLKRRKYGYYSKSQIGSPLTTFKMLIQNPNLMKFNIISIVSFLPMGMILPFSQPFANEVKGANEFVLGTMVTGLAIIPLAFGIPSGKLADRIGRKKLLYLIAPLFWTSNLFLIWAPNSTFLIVAGMLQGFLYINLVITGAIQFELVEPEFMGRWLGIILFFRMLVAAATSFLAGLIWDKIGPQYIFLIYIGLDIFIRIPLLVTLPETLRTKTRANSNSPTS
jgi:MFS family permease